MTRIEFTKYGEKTVEMSIKSGCVSIGKDVAMLLNLEEMETLVANLQKCIEEMRQP